LSRLSAALFALLLATDAAGIETMIVQVPRSGAATGSAVTGPSDSIEVARDHALVRVEGSTASFAGSVQAGGGLVTTDLGSGWVAVTLPPGMNAVQGLPWLRALPGAKEVQYDHIYRPNLTVNDPLSSSQFGLDQINARQAWDYETGTSARVTIAVVDSGIENTHIDLSSAMANTVSRAFAVGSGAMTVDGPPVDVECNHATRVAGIAAARGNNGTLMTGVAFGGGTQLVSYRVFDNGSCLADCSNVGCTTDDAAIIGAVNRAVTDAGDPAYGRMVVNVSLGCNGVCACSNALQTAVNNAVNAGVVIVAASGNTGGPVTSPGNCSGVIPVGSTDASGAISSFSSRGPELAAGGLVAPGQGVLSTTPGDTTVSSIQGTSFAAPHVAGVAALILAAKPLYTVAQVLATLRNSSDPVGFGTQGESPYYKTQGNASGAGRLNAFLAMRLAVTGQLADFQGEDKVVAFPNPFRADRHQNVTFAFPTSIQNASDVSIKIYTQDGALVRDLNSLTWNTKNDQGRFVASGTYVFVVSTSRGKRSGRISVLR
jgi:subtilisin family serine protease